MAIEVDKKEIKPVTSAVLHAATLATNHQTTVNQVKCPGIKLTWEKGEGLHVEWKGKSSLIPHPNVVELQFE